MIRTGIDKRYLPPAIQLTLLCVLMLATACGSETDDQPPLASREPGATTMATLQPAIGVSPSSGPPAPSATPDALPQEARDTADSVAALLVAGDIDSLMALATPTEIECRPLEATHPLCANATPFTKRLGYRVEQHGGEGEAVDSEGLRAAFAAATTARPRLASVGCVVGAGDCSTIIVAFENPGARSRVFFVSLQGRPPRITGIGMSGDDAEVILAGGISKTAWGDVRYVPYPAGR
ncbi:MAG: hypothetical protein AB7F89_23785 [Pirellulaceae bacterium]